MAWPEGIVGREAERARLAAEWDAARGGSGRVVLLAGEAGIGKTTLANDLAAAARHAGATVAWGACWAKNGAPALWPWTEAVRSLADTDPDAVAQLAARRDDLAHVVPELATDGLGGLQDADAQFRVFGAVVAFLRAVTRTTPAVILLDDLHWADATSVDLLRFVARSLRDAPLLVVGTYRHNERANVAGLGDLVEEVTRDGGHIRLHGLGVRDVLEITGGDAARADALCRQTGGNPFFLRELSLMDSDGHVPAGVRSVLTRRLGVLHPSTREVLRYAAAYGIGRVDVLTAAGFDAAQVIDAFDEAIKEEVMIAAHGATVFVHALFREVLLTGHNATVRREMHTALARAIERVVAPIPAQELAHHLREAALAGGDRAEAARWCRRGGDEALASVAFAEAEARFADALALTAAGELDQRFELLVLLADARRYRGDLDTSKAAYLAALDVARELDDAQRFAETALLLAQRGGPMPLFLDFGEEESIAALDEALAWLPDTDSALRARLLAQLGLDLIIPTPKTQRDPAATLALAEAMAARVGDRMAMYEAAVNHFNLWQVWEAPPTHTYERVLELGRGLGPLIEAAALMTATLAAATLGDVRRADAYWQEASEVAATVGLRSVEPTLLVYRAMRLHMDGDLAAVEQLLTQVRELVRETRNRYIASQRGVLAFLLTRDRGELPEADRVRTRAQTFPMPAMHAAIAWTLAEQGHAEEAAVALYRVLGGEPPAVPPQDINRAVWWFICAHVAYALDDRAAASWLYDQADYYRGHYIRAGLCAMYGAADLAVGLLARTLGGVDDAVASFAAAVELNDALPTRPFATRARLCLAEALIDRGNGDDGPRGRTLAAEARDAAQSMGMPLVARAAEVLIGDAPTRAPAPPASAATGVFRREGDVWLVAFGGASTRVRDSKGMADIAVLLARPGREVHVSDLIGAEVDGGGAKAPTLDAHAVAAFRERILELEDDEDEAESRGDYERAARARAEHEALVERLAADLGLGGRARSIADPMERARKTVQRRVATTLKRIGDAHPALGRHLRASLNTGIFCAYEPPEPVSWDL